MRQRRFAMIRSALRTSGSVATGLALAGAVSGCAGIPAFESAHVAAAAPNDRDLRGTWYGNSDSRASSYYPDEANCVLRIAEDGMFTIGLRAVERGEQPRGGIRVVGNGDRRWRLDHVPDAPGAVVTLVRSGDTLYGMAADPNLVGAIIMIRFDREGRRT